MNRSKVDELLCEALETERGGVKIYEVALSCAQNADLRKEWRSSWPKAAVTSRY